MMFCMTSRTSLQKIIIAVFIISTALMAWYIFSAYRETSSSIVIPSITTSTAPTKATDRAFINVGAHASTAKPGSRWTVLMTAPAWAKCMADVYNPSGQVQIFENTQDAEATTTAAGQFKWTWFVPANAVKGQWTIKLLCGTFDNLAATDVPVRVE
ncbi:hypothetical protein KKD42_02250 [Patescibacteria group bacterium]|nr:hypothetical protein [Patescibacteria group bacterium]